MYRSGKLPATFPFGCSLFFLALLLAMNGSAFAKKPPPAQPVDINAGTLKELEELPGVGPTTAKAIIDFRNKSGRFRRINDLLAIRGISEAKLAKMRPYIILGTLPVKTAPPPKTAAPAKTPPAAKISTPPKSTPPTINTTHAPPTAPAANSPQPSQSIPSTSNSH